MTRGTDVELLRRFRAGESSSALRAAGYSELELDWVRELTLWGGYLPAPGALGGGGGGLGGYSIPEGRPDRQKHKQIRRPE